MKDLVLFYGKFAALLGVITLMVGINFVTWGFHRASRRPVWNLPGAVPERGPTLIKAYGCGACHSLPNSTENPRKVGPSLVRINEQAYLAGKLANTPQNMVRWIQNPQAVRPHTAMPDLDVNEKDARDIVAYLLDP
jgi:cytochrome c2